jgi:hypothetical protein
MIEHSHSEIGVQEEDEFIAVGLSGIASGLKADAVLQHSKKPDAQDTQLGHDKLYFDYNQLGGYGIVGSVTIVGSRTIKVKTLEKANKYGIPDTELIFTFVEDVPTKVVEILRSICAESGTEISVE